MSDITKKQYILSSQALNFPGMVAYSVGEVYLYTHPQLKVERTVTKSGLSVLVLGNAYCADMPSKCVQEDIAQWDGKNLTQLTRYWTGRFVVIAGDRLITDACGLMAAFYKREDSGWMVSSSLAMIAACCDIPRGEVCEQMGLNWHLLPGTKVAGVSKLYSTQKISFSAEDMEVQENIWPEDCTGLSTQEKAEQVCNLLTNACKNIANAAPNGVWLALTGGKDSRLIFAALLNADVSFKTYTSAYPGISQADKQLPKTMSKDFGIPHSYIKRGKYDSAKATCYRQFTHGDSNGLDAQFYAYGQFDPIPADAVVVRSGIFEAGQTYGRTIAGNTVESFEQGFRSYYSDALKNETQSKALSQWLQWAEEHPIPNVDIRDRFYVEQRVGGWAAVIEQSLDINGFTSIQIANCPRLVSVLLSCSEQERQQLSVVMASINRMCAKLMQYPVNQRTIWDKMLYILSILRNPVKKMRNFINRYKRK